MSLASLLTAVHSVIASAEPVTGEERETVSGIAMRDLRRAFEPATAISIGTRVVHVRTGGRVRGIVTELHFTANSSKATVLIDELRGREMDYDLSNLAVEPPLEARQRTL